MSLYEQLCQREILLASWYSIYKKKSKDKKKRGKDINGLTLYEYQKNHSERIDQLLRELNEKSFTTAPLKGFYRTKPGKKTKRLIGIAAINDRIVQKAILTIITSSVMPHLKNGVSFGCVSKGRIRDSDEVEPVGIKGAMTHFVKAVSQKRYWVFKSDIESFYDAIPKERIYKKIIELLPDASLNEILKEFIFFRWGNPEEIFDTDHVSNEKIGIAQGPPLSPIFSNIYLIHFDKEMKTRYGENFIRYADDFIIICKIEDEAKVAKEIATKLLDIEKLKLSPDISKTLIMSLKTEPLIFLGLKVTRQKIVSKKAPGEIKSHLNNLLTGNLNIKSKIINANQYLQGIFQSLKNYHCQKIFEEINAIIINKRKIKIYSSLKTIDLLKIKPIISIEIWDSYFH